MGKLSDFGRQLVQIFTRQVEFGGTLLSRSFDYSDALVVFHPRALAH